MKNSKILDAIDSLVEVTKLTNIEIEEIYQILDKQEIETFLIELQNFGDSLPENANEFTLLKFLKNINQNSPKVYETLQKIVRENKQLFDKIQDIFIEKIL